MARVAGRIQRSGMTLVALAAMACSNTPTGPSNTQQGGTTVTGVTVSVTPSPAKLTIAAQATAVVQPTSAQQSVTWSTSDNTIATIDNTGLITLRLRGQVTITATSTVDPNVSGSVTLTVECPDPRLVTQPLSGPTTWQNWVPDPACYDYIAQVDAGSNNYDLTIEAGTVVGFEEGTSLSMRNNGALIAEGTKADPIVLTGTTRVRGFWDGVSFLATKHNRNVMKWVTVEYTGGADISGEQDASLIVGRDGIATIQNSTFRESEGYGVSLGLYSEITDAQGNVMTANALGPAYSYATTVPSLNGATLTGNDVDEVVVKPLTIDQDATWPRATFRILETGTLAVSKVVLTLVPGTELRFEPGQKLLIQTQSGLSAVGTAQAPIVFTGTQPTPGHWDGIAFVGSSRAENRLEHVVVEYGGGGLLGGATEAANVVLTRAGSGVHSLVTIQNSTLRSSAGYGLWLRVDSGLTDFTGNTLTANVLGPAYAHAPSVEYLLPSNSYAGNGTDEIAVEAGSGYEIDGAATWHDLGVPYYLHYKVGPTLSVTGQLKIEAGVKILVEADLGISVTGAGVLTTMGGANNRVSIGAKAAAWKGIVFVGVTGSLLSMTDVTGAGSSAWGGVGSAGVISVNKGPSGAKVTLQLVTLDGPGVNIAFSSGNSLVAGCVGTLWIPAGETKGDHCV
jgi:Bacterial Ig-like domain (group 2)